MDGLSLREFVERVSIHLRPLLNREGTVLYSGAQTLAPGDIYFLGLNPGGQQGGGETIGQALRGLPEWRGNNYLDRDWGPGAGRALLQQRVQWLMREIGFDLRQVCSSNLIFVGSPNEESASYNEVAHVCWPVHQEILRIVQPRAVLVYGKAPLRWLTQDLDEEGPAEDLGNIPSGHGSWMCTAARRKVVGRDRTIIGLPHLSRYDVRGKTNVIHWIESLIGQQAA